ncbi:helix-turn-helix protein [anaerobic digester metagenome]
MSSGLGKEIKSIRKQKKLTQKEVAKAAGISEITLRKYEAESVPLKMDTLQKIADAFKITLAQLLDHEMVTAMKKHANAFDGLLAILADMYGYADVKLVESEFGDACYYLIGEGDERFIIHEMDFDVILDMVNKSVQPVIERMKDTRPEAEIINEISIDLNSSENRKAIAELKKKWKHNN